MEEAAAFFQEVEVEMQEALYGIQVGEPFYGIDLAEVLRGEARGEAFQGMEIGETLGRTEISEDLAELVEFLETDALEDVNETESGEVVEEFVNGNGNAMAEEFQLHVDEMLEDGDGSVVVQFSINANAEDSAKSGCSCGSFDPVLHELDATFRLTKYSGVKSSGRKASQETLSKILGELQNQSATLIGTEASVTPLQTGDGQLRLVQTSDFFYPLIDDPYVQGKITCANVLSKLYVLGVTECDSVGMLTTLSSKLTDKERDVVLPLLINGYKDAAREAGTTVAGVQTLVNSWITVGGMASSICKLSDILMTDNAMAGDVLLLTKPLGTQIAVLLYNCLDDPERWSKIKNHVVEDDIRKAYSRAVNSMTRLNRTAARLMHKYNAHAVTYVSGLSLLFHAKKLVQKQKEELFFCIHNLPVIAKVGDMLKALGSNLFQRLNEGLSEETSGGLLICLPRPDATEFCIEMQQIEGFQSAWIVGVVKKGNRTVEVIPKPRIIDAPFQETVGKLW